MNASQTLQSISSHDAAPTRVFKSCIIPPFIANMTITPDQYEKLGTFYLGREYDVGTKKMNENLVLYDSKDLVTHGVVLGMTGSGKTGLCLSLLEEAAMDGVPVIAIDPKGDIGNFLLSFPGLTPEEFKPWVNADDARRKGRTVEEHAASTAEMWKKGLGEWGQTGERIRKMRETVDMAIYTPGSNAGLPVSILSSLDAPSDEIMEDREILSDRIESTVSSMLGLMNVNADPVQSPEHILLSNIVSHFWAKRQNLSLEVLVRAIQQPPIRKVGVVDIDTFLPESKRTELAMKLNSLLASPGFGVWMEGEPLDIQRMFYTPEGKPRVSIFCISHLSDTERTFFVSLLLNQLLGWMRAQAGTTSLRALFYMDEIYGYLPPTANPPTKKPMMILLKQARAFGLGLLLGTQNPVDLDYKALSNIGTWFLGRLQTERDKARVLDGLEGAAGSSGAAFDRPQLERLLSSLGNRIFLMNNVHEDHPAVFQVRWAMSYLSGPLSRGQIKTLMDPIRPAAGSKKGGSDDGFAPPSGNDAGVRNTIKPRLPEGVEEYFAPAEHVDPDRLCYVPSLLRSAVVSFDDSKRGISGRSTVTMANQIDVKGQRVNWDKFIDVPKDLNLDKLLQTPEDDAEYAELPGAAMKSSTYSSIEKDFIDWVYRNHSMEVYTSPLLEAFSNPGESQGDFRVRMTQIARERRDKAVDDLRAKSAKEVKALEAKATKAMDKVESEKSQASSARMSTIVQIGSSLLGALLGRKSGVSAATSVIKGTSVSSVSRAWKESRDAASAEQELDRLKAEMGELEQKLGDETQRIRDQYDPATLVLETVKLTPTKKDIQPTATGILWLPHERVGDDLNPAWSKLT